MRVLMEFNGRRVDIKDPVSNRAGRPDNSNMVEEMINQALEVLGIKGSCCLVHKKEGCKNV